MLRSCCPTPIPYPIPLLFGQATKQKYVKVDSHSHTAFFLPGGHKLLKKETLAQMELPSPGPGVHIQTNLGII